MNSEVLDNKQEQSNPLALATLDLPEILSLVRRRESARRELPPSARNLRLYSLGRLVAEMELSRVSPPPLLLQLQRSFETTVARMTKLRVTGHQPLAVTLRQINTDTYRVLMNVPHLGTKPLEFDVPVGLPRVINVATLKAMVGAGPWDVVFQKAAAGERWEVCPDDHPVDLEDRTHVFKIRQWAILS